MLLNKEHGEVLEGLPAGRHVVIEPRILAELNRYRCDYEVPKKFGFETRQRSVYEDAVAHARKAFEDAGALLPVIIDTDHVLVQAYPDQLMIAVVIARVIAGKSNYVVREYPTPQPVMDALLAASGKPVRMH